MLHRKQTTYSNDWEKEDTGEEVKEGVLVYLKAWWGWIFRAHVASLTVIWRSEKKKIYILSSITEM